MIRSELEWAQRVSALQSDVVRLIEELDTANGELKQTRETLNYYITEKVNLKKELEELMLADDELMADRDSLAEQNADLAAENEDLRRQLKELRDKQAPASGSGEAE